MTESRPNLRPIFGDSDLYTDPDSDTTPRPSKKRNLVGTPILSPNPSSSSVASSRTGDSELESHNSGRTSPTKQMTQLEDLASPIFFRDFGAADAAMPADVEKIRAAIQLLADGIGILAYTEDELKSCLADNSLLNHADQTRFRYAWANDPVNRQRIGDMVPLRKIKKLVTGALVSEGRRVHEHDWNEQVHNRVLEQALKTSCHFEQLDVIPLKTAYIRPTSLTQMPLPKRIVDYGIVLRSDSAMSEAFERLLPLPKADVKSWNNTIYHGVRRTPIAVSIETKESHKSWTDGFPQLAIWTSTFLKRLHLLKSGVRIPAMPLLIAQGHDWHLIIIAQQPPPDKRLILWQNINIGNTRNSFDACKLIAVLHWVMDWAETVWRPFFHSLIADLA